MNTIDGVGAETLKDFENDNLQPVWAKKIPLQ